MVSFSLKKAVALWNSQVNEGISESVSEWPSCGKGDPNTWDGERCALSPLI